MDSETPIDRLVSRIPGVSLDMDSESMRKAGYRVVDWLIQRTENLRESPLGRELSREETEKLLREPMPEDPRDFEEVLEEYTRNVAPNAIQLDHPRFFAFIPSAPSFVAVLADALVAGTNVFAGTWLESSGPSQVELIVIDWFKEMLGLPPGAAGLLVSGGSVANLTALAVARHAILDDNVAGAVVYLSDQTHASVDRGLRLLGIPPQQVKRIPPEADLRLNTTKLVEQIRRDRSEGLCPFAVVANAGTTNTGAVDPLPGIGAIAREQGIWFHVDAAYGGFAALSERGRKHLAGIERADSVVLDPHKWLYCPFEAGCVIVREGRLLPETFRILPEYMRDVAREEREVNFCDYGLQLTRSFRALKVWMTFKTFGARRLRQIINQCLDLTAYAARLFRESPHLQIVTPPSLGVFTFRYVPRKLNLDDAGAETRLNRLNQRLVAKIISSQKLMLSSTQVGPRYVIRFCVLNHRTRGEDIVEALRLIENFGRELEEDLA
jgi:glutamate/tyrosine decarboxylase-like PLP-dependent enzyme